MTSWTCCLTSVGQRRATESPGVDLVDAFWNVPLLTFELILFVGRLGGSCRVRDDVYSVRINTHVNDPLTVVRGSFQCRCLSACGFTALARWRIARFSALISIGIVGKRCGEVLAALQRTSDAYRSQYFWVRLQRRCRGSSRLSRLLH